MSVDWFIVGQGRNANSVDSCRIAADGEGSEGFARIV